MRNISGGALGSNEAEGRWLCVLAAQVHCMNVAHWRNTRQSRDGRAAASILANRNHAPKWPRSKILKSRDGRFIILVDEVMRSGAINNGSEISGDDSACF